MKEGSRVKTKPDRPWNEDAHGAPGGNGPGQTGGRAESGVNGKLTILTLSQILAWKDDPEDLILRNGYIEKGMPFVFCGPPGVGKSRLIVQLAIDSILNRPFLEWDTQAANLVWLFLQSENGMRRLQYDLKLMTAKCTPDELARIEKQFFIHGLVNDTDGYLNLSDPDARKRVVEAIENYNPDVVVGDPLAGMSSGDLNQDQDMLAVARDFGRIVRANNPKRAPGILHHSRTGKAAIQGMTGFDRASFGRNSKALYGWTRSQINVAAANENDSDKLIIASGKCNNAKEFSPFFAQLNCITMSYSRVAGDVDEWMKGLNAKENTGRPSKYDKKQILKAMNRTVARGHDQIMREVCEEEGKGVHATGMSTRTFNNYWKELKMLGKIREETTDKWVIA